MKRVVLLLVACMVLLAGTVFAAAAAGDSGIKGNVTWKYSRLVYNRGDDGRATSAVDVQLWKSKAAGKVHGDAGAKIILIPKDFDKNSLSEDQEREWYTLGIVPEGKNIFITQANNEGYYEITGVPSGEYLLIIISQKEKQHYVYAEPLLQRYIRNWDMFNTFVLSGCEYTRSKVMIKAGKMTAQNASFEYTRQYGVDKSGY